MTAIYTITNAGPALATDVALSDAWSDAPATVHVLAGGAAPAATHRLHPGRPAAGASVQLRLSLSFSPQAALAATAAVSTDKGDPNPGNDGAPAAIALSGVRETRTLGLLASPPMAFSTWAGA